MSHQVGRIKVPLPDFPKTRDTKKKMNAPDRGHFLLDEIGQLDHFLPRPRPILDPFIPQPALLPPFHFLPRPLTILQLDPLAVQTLQQRDRILVRERDRRDRRDVDLCRGFSIARQPLRRIRQRRVIRWLTGRERIARIEREVLHAAALNAAGSSSRSGGIGSMVGSFDDVAVFDRVGKDHDADGSGFGGRFHFETAEGSAVLDGDDLALDVDACGRASEKAAKQQRQPSFRFWIVLAT